jgi:hypothetical protein
MTNNIEKLYENTGIEKKYCGWLDMGDLDTQYEYVMCDTLEEYKETAEFSRTSYSSDNENYMTPEIKYPPFTAEKQLELIKWLCINTYRHYIHFRFERDIDNWKMESNMVGIIEYASFEECLAGLINSLWQDLTPDQKQEIKEILK